MATLPVSILRHMQASHILIIRRRAGRPGHVCSID
jgi:hypothetical protein